MPIGSSIPPEELLQGNRARLYDLILARPGIRFTDLVAAAGLHFGSTLHHLFLLERFQLVRSYKTDRSRRYVAALGAPEETRRAAHLAEERVRKTLEYVQAHPGSTQARVAAAFPEVCRQAVAYRLRHLCRLGLVTVERNGRGLAYRPATAATTPSSPVLLALEVPA